MNLKCFKCKEYFIPSMNTVKIIGPDVEITCPFCYDTYFGKLNKYVDKQLGKHLPLSPIYAAAMIALAEYIELNSSDYYKEKGLRHGRKKKIRDLRVGKQPA